MPVAQYLRMSAEHQRYSTTNQREAIGQYARANGMEVVCTYEDSGRSGLTLRGRPALQRLLTEVHDASRCFKAIVVFDVSRWGRFQDVDESAFYEFLCRRAGVNVHYCAESFDCVPGPMAAVVKSIKRAMAAEYSKELSGKVYSSLQALARRGFHTGGPAGFGLKRVQVSPDGRVRRELPPGERKSRADDHVELEPGDAFDCGLVRLIFHLFVHCKMKEADIALQLNWSCYPSQIGLIPWRADAIRTVLRREQYVGTNVFGLHTQKLKSASRYVRKDQRIRVPNSFTPVVSQLDFDAAQLLVGDRLPRRKWSRSDLIRLVRSEAAEFGRFNVAALHRRGGPAALRFIECFGSVADACSAANVPICRRTATSGRRRKQRQAIKVQILDWLAEHYRESGRTFYCHTSTRRACIEDSLTISVRVAHPQVSHDSFGWTLRPDKLVDADLGIFARVNDKAEILDYFVIPREEDRNGFVNSKGAVTGNWLEQCRCASPADVIYRLESSGSSKICGVTRMLRQSEARRTRNLHSAERTVVKDVGAFP
ncbi:serine recombinase [Lysobacter caseinilyticus]|uniref:Serine recombinase n=1 Tax=Noviluteimonas caseinilytica TaxID=2675101 RepID=A0ABN6FNN4_9GAMM|nr:serine recombinase [Lysobacter caseinilyticus]